MDNAAIRFSQRIYRLLLKFYPRSYRREYEEEMQYVFVESLKDAYADDGGAGILLLWTRTMLDTGHTLVRQHVDNWKEHLPMETRNRELLAQNRVILWLALATVLILLISLVAMQFSGSMDWDLFDFVLAGTLIFGAGLVFVLAARRIHKHRLILGLVVMAILFWLWAEIAVGVFTNWGS